MWFIALDWRNTIHVIAMIALASGGGGLVLWLLLPGLSRSEEKEVAALKTDDSSATARSRMHTGKS